MTDRILGAPLTAAERAAVLIELRNLIGVPWRHKGRTERGIDCLGMLWLPLYRVVRASRGLALPKPADDYGRTPYNRRLRAELIQWLGDPVPMDIADIATMRWTGEEHHVGFLVPHPYHGRGLIHADNTACGGSKVVEHGIDYVWQRRLIEGWAL